MKSKKKMNTYLRFVLIVLGATAFGAVCGFAISYGGRHGLNDVIGAAVEALVIWVQKRMPVLLALILAATAVVSERNLHRLKAVLAELSAAEDDDYDRISYEEDRIGGQGMIINMISQILSILILACGYSYTYIRENDNHGFLIACVLCVACFLYNGLYQVRFVKMIQKEHPELKGDPSSTKFRRQWVDSCDEAQREIIYRSAYASYLWMTGMLPVLLVVTMLANLFWETGILAVAVVAVIWLGTTVTYLHNCTKLQKQKIS